MEYAIGIALAVLVAAFAAIVGLDRDRAFYPTVLTVIASYYGLFAVMAGSVDALVAELVPMAVFVAATVTGFRRNLWIVVAGLAAHGAFDFVHAQLITNPGVPAWWPPFCLAFDVIFAGILAWMLWQSRIRAEAA